ncbi:MAG: beta-propeller fold lactonase family protein [Gluconacetobacter diazotrophicus]|nr:beta-propeller fold lactonase family protein [Gluconacetobacter diazotrophicus]
MFRELSSNVAIIALAFAASVGIAHAQSAPSAQGTSTGAVFAASNARNGNEITMYARNPRGALRLVGTFPTGGRGEGGINDPLQSSASVVATPDHRFLLVANAGSGDVSVFRILPEGLALASVTPSGGGNPVSIAVHGNLVYVVNFGGNVHTAGFALEASGRLRHVKDSIRPLSSLDSNPSTVAFTPDGSRLVVSERLTNRIDVFTVDADGSLSNPVFNASQGVEPFGLAFTPGGALLVTEAGSGATSSYAVEPDNTLGVITRLAPSGGAADCWVATDGRNAWVTNTVTGSIGAYAVARNGALDPLGVVASVPAAEPVLFPDIEPATSFPLDIAVSDDDRFVYVDFSDTGRIVGYRIAANGALSKIADVPDGEPQTGVEGLAAY